MKVSELARAAGVTPHTVRFYARDGLLQPSRNKLNGYASFSRADVARLRFIRKAQRLGFTLAEVHTIFEMADREESPCPLVRQIVSTRLAQLRGHLDELTAAEARMRQALQTWRLLPDAVPTGTHVCRLIETLGDDH